MNEWRNDSGEEKDRKTKKLGGVQKMNKTAMKRVDQVTLCLGDSRFLHRINDEKDHKSVEGFSHSRSKVQCSL